MKCTGNQPKQPPSIVNVCFKGPGKCSLFKRPVSNPSLLGFLYLTISQLENSLLSIHYSFVLAIYF